MSIDDRPTYVVLDSVALWSDPWFTEARSQLFLRFATGLGSTVAIPEVVKIETFANQKRKMDESATKFRTALRNLAKVSNVEFQDPTEIALTAFHHTFSAHLDHIIDEHHWKVLPIPDIDHETMVERFAVRAKPFSDKGSGYRDSLIWNSILALAESNSPSKIAFITANKSDFCGDDMSLHPELRSELAEIIPGSEIQIIKTIPEFVSRYIEPTFRPTDESQELLAKLRASTPEQINVQQEISKYLSKVIGTSGFEYESEWMIFDYEVSTFYADRLIELKSIEVDRAVMTSPHRALVTIQANAVIEFQTSVYAADRDLAEQYWRIKRDESFDTPNGRALRLFVDVPMSFNMGVSISVESGSIVVDAMEIVDDGRG